MTFPTFPLIPVAQFAGIVQPDFLQNFRCSSYSFCFIIQICWRVQVTAVLRGALSLGHNMSHISTPTDLSAGKFLYRSQSSTHLSRKHKFIALTLFQQVKYTKFILLQKIYVLRLVQKRASVQFGLLCLSLELENDFKLGFCVCSSVRSFVCTSGKLNTAGKIVNLSTIRVTDYCPQVLKTASNTCTQLTESPKSPSDQFLFW